MRSCATRAVESAWPIAPATSCATPVSRDFEKRAWPSRPSRPKPGTRSIETTRIYLHLSNEWLADEYARAISLIDHSVLEAVAQ
jgi:hypothetical protein